MKQHRDCELNAAQSGVHQLECDWNVCSDIYEQMANVRLSGPRTKFESEIIFCLLGGHGVRFELCASAAKIVSDLDPFSEHWVDGHLYEELISVLELPQFEPPRENGSLRKYRFPTRKARILVEARRWIHLNAPIEVRLEELGETNARREFLCDCPGIGPKTASWVLRNMGYGANLAILDIHVIRAMQDAGRVNNLKLPDDYAIAEIEFLRWCDELDATPEAFDLFVWDWQRGVLQ